MSEMSSWIALSNQSKLSAKLLVTSLPKRSGSQVHFAVQKYVVRVLGLIG